jgi:hypothetical protein
MIGALSSFLGSSLRLAGSAGARGSLWGVRNATAIVFVTPRTPSLPLRNDEATTRPRRDLH